MDLSTDTVHDIVHRLWEAGVVTDYAHEYGEPGYDFTVRADTETPIFLIGDWWCRCGHNPHTGRPKGYPYGTGELVEPGDLHDVMSHHPRLWAQLEAQGVETAFYDEWMVDSYGDKAYRTQPDSYGWQPSVIVDDTGEWLTPDSDIEEWIAWATQSPNRCLFRSHVNQLVDAGFEPWPDEDTWYESGWHPGQTDDPATITEQIRAGYPDHDIVFAVTDTGQFDIRFRAFIRPEQP
jgi:hypothetical protein